MKDQVSAVVEQTAGDDAAARTLCCRDELPVRLRSLGHTARPERVEGRTVVGSDAAGPSRVSSPWYNTDMLFPSRREEMP